MSDAQPFPIKPKADFVIVELAPTEAKTEGGIIIPESAKEKSRRGTVRAVGPGKPAPGTTTPVPLETKVGDEVLFNKFAGTEILAGVTPCVIMREADIVATL